MRDYLRIPESKMRVAHARREHQRPDAVTDRRSRRRRDPFTIGFFARIAPEKGLHNLAEAYRILRTDKGLPPSRLVAAGYLRAGTQAVSRRHRRRACAPPDSATSSCIAAPSIARRRCSSSTTSTCCRCRAAITSRRACICSRRWRAACRSCSRTTARFPEIIARTGGGVLAKSEVGRRCRRRDLRTVEGSGARRGARPRAAPKACAGITPCSTWPTAC